MSNQTVVPVVVDTNVLVPSLYRKTHILDFILKGNLALVWNNFIYDEAVEIIERMNPIYLPKTNVHYREILELLDLILDENFKVPDMPANWPNHSLDRDDDPFLFAAVQGKAKYIISDDKKHMLQLGSFNGIPIGTPSSFFPWVIRNFPIEKIK